jgi:hypothetical protein
LEGVGTAGLFPDAARVALEDLDLPVAVGGLGAAEVVCAVVSRRAVTVFNGNT